MTKGIQTLVVDDDDYFLEKISRKLRNIGYDVSELNKGSEVMAYVEKNRPQVILMDTNLGASSGIEICHNLRGKEYGREIVIVGMSNGNYRREWINGGGDSFVDKLIATRKDSEVLERIINNALCERGITKD